MSDTSTDKPTTERRVYVLPLDLLERIRSYQSDNNISSEVEAARRLLSEALQARDTINDLMKQVRAYHRQEKDLRALARDVLSGHILVIQIKIDDNKIEFGLRNGEAGMIRRDGKMETGTINEDGTMWFNTSWPPLRSEKSVKSSGGWDSPPSDDLDDTIPF